MAPPPRRQRRWRAHWLRPREGERQWCTLLLFVLISICAAKGGGGSEFQNDGTGAASVLQTPTLASHDIGI